MTEQEAKARQDMISCLVQHKSLTDEQLNNLENLVKDPSRYIKHSGLEKQNANPDAGFIKHDTGKRRLSLIEPLFVQALGDVITFGAEKYAPNNWRLCEDTSRYKDALLRHIYAYLSGERFDHETQLSHLAHVACNCMFLQWFDEKDNNVHAE